MAKRMLQFVVSVLLLAGVASAQTTTYSGTIKDLSGNPVTSGQVTFTLTPRTDSTIPGVGRFVPTTIPCNINSDGTLSGYVAGVVSGACVVANNTSLSPTGTAYRVCIQPNYQTPGSCFYDYALGAPKDISTVAPTLTTGPLNYNGVAGPPGPQGATGVPGSITANGVNGGFIVPGVLQTASNLFQSDQSTCTLTQFGFAKTCQAVGITFSADGNGTASERFSGRKVTFSGAGVSYNNPGSQGWRYSAIQNDEMDVYNRGIAQGFTVRCNKYAVGDFGCGYFYTNYDGGSNGNSDEGYTSLTLQTFQNGPPYTGTVSATTGTGDITPTLSTATSGVNQTIDGTYLLNITKGTISGTFTGASTPVAGYPLMNSLPVSNSLTLSTAICLTTTSIPGTNRPVNQQANDSVTCTLGAIGGTTPAFAAGSYACVAGVGQPEEGKIVSASAPSGGSQTFVLSHHNAFDPGATITQGGLCGNALSMDADFAFSGLRSSYFVMGSRTGSDLMYAVIIGGGVGTALPLEGEIETTTSPLNGYHLYPFAEIVKNNVGSAGGTLAPNHVAWAVGDVVSDPHHMAISGNALFDNCGQNSTPIQVYGGSSCLQIQVSGTGTGHGYHPLRIHSNNQISMFKGSGSYHMAPSEAVDVDGLFGSTLQSTFLPLQISGQVNAIIRPLFAQGNDATPVPLFSLPFANGSSSHADAYQLTYNPNGGALSWKGDSVCTSDPTTCPPAALPVKAHLTLSTTASTETFVVMGLTGDGPVADGSACAIGSESPAASANFTSINITSYLSNSITINHSLAAGQNISLVCVP